VHCDALRDEREAALGPRTPGLWRRTLVRALDAPVETQMETSLKTLAAAGSG
jgi:hypothetical protein